jgi:hypothetical protein
MIDFPRNYKKMVFLTASGAATSQEQFFEGGTGIVHISGTISGSTISLEYKEDGGWITIPVPEAGLQMYQFETPPGIIRAKVTGGSSPSVWLTIYRRYAM